MRIKHLAFSILFSLFIWWGFFALLFATPYEIDFTDSGVSCVDDCLEPIEGSN